MLDENRDRLASGAADGAVLRAAANSELPVSEPTYDRSTLRAGIVHIGVGGFHRAHLALYVDELCRLGVTDWAIVGAGILAGDAAMADALSHQDHLYTVVVRDTTGTTVRIVGSIIDYLHAHPDSTALEQRIAHPDTQIVSLTITEGGYPVDDATGRYLPDSPVAGDRSAFAILARGLDQRRRSGGGPLTVLSCDNIVSNGDATRAATLGEAARVGDELVPWIGQHVSFPNAMVDRITPTTSDDDRRWLADTVGIHDRWPVFTEAFSLWVIEDDFAGDRLPLELLDVVVTDDVEPFELMSSASSTPGTRHWPISRPCSATSTSTTPWPTRPSGPTSTPS